MKDSRFADKIGAEYALFPLAAPHYAELQKLAATLVGKNCPETARILEIGCGNGITTLQLVAAMPQATIIAIDAEKVMVQQAKIALADTQVTCLVEEAHQYLVSQAADSFDAVVTAFTLHNLRASDRLLIFQEIGRVLRPGGILVQADKIAQDDILEHWPALRSQIDAFQVFKTTEYPELQSEWTAHYLQDDKIRLTESEQKVLFEEAGCASVTLHPRWGMDMVWSGIKD